MEGGKTPQNAPIVLWAIFSATEHVLFVAGSEPTGGEIGRGPVRDPEPRLRTSPQQEGGCVRDSVDSPTFVTS